MSKRSSPRSNTINPVGSPKKIKGKVPMSSRPGAAVRTGDGTIYEVLDDFNEIVKRIQAVNEIAQDPQNSFIELIDYNSGKRISFRIGSIDRVMERGY
jgi:hypothetical protein